MNTLAINALICLTFVKVIVAENILGILPHFGYSHFKVFEPILEELAERGHNITVISYFKTTRSFANYRQFVLAGKKTIDVVVLEDYKTSRSLMALYDEFWGLHYEGQESCRNFYESEYVQKVLELHKRQPFDIVITEYFNSDCQLALPKVMGVKRVIGLSSCTLMPFYYDRIALPDTPSHVQSEFIGFTGSLSFVDRFVNFVQAKVLKYLYRFVTNRADDALVRKYLDVEFDSHEAAKTLTSLIFVNQHFSLTGSRPYTPQLVEIGGIHIKKDSAEAKLPIEIDEFLKSAKGKEVLLISWGSMLRASTVNRDTLHGILRALIKSNLKVIWRWESDVLPIKDDNILFVKWIPQLALLCHPQVKYFWSHGGMLGTLEAFYAGKPLILTPFYGDQFINAHSVENRGTGLILEFGDLNEKTLGQAIAKIQQKQYTERAQVFSQLFRDSAAGALETSIRWIEYVMRHKEIANEVLQTNAVHLNWFVYHSIDVICVLSICIALALLTVGKLVCLIAVILRRRTSNAKTKIN